MFNENRRKHGNTKLISLEVFDRVHPQKDPKHYI